ncbi:MAG TPA: DoxX family protein [Longimicrobium sp.]|nr:DoxX family protein [Longimicrobium sp.]
MVQTWTQDATMLDAGLLAARLTLGPLMAAHGAQKLFGWFGGPGVRGTAAGMEHLGFRPGLPFAVAAGATEAASGVLVALGLLGPAGPALMVSVMIVAAVSAHLKNGLFAQNGGIELPLVYAAVAFGLALTGPGGWSADAALGLAWLSAPGFAWIALAIGIAGGAANLLARRPAPVTEEAAAPA